MSSFKNSRSRVAEFALVAAFAIFALSCRVAAAQDRAQSKCPPSDSAASAVRIVFDRVSEDKTGKKEVVLRLVNGAECKIYVGVQDHSFVVSESGSRNVQEGEELPDGVELEPHYFEQELQDSEWKVVTTGGGCVSIHQKIIPGRSILFRVPLETFGRHRNVQVYFNFVGENTDDVWHATVFEWSAVPGV
jgi:hypothetical protein